MNAVAGIYIGWASEAWNARLLLPFIWGVVWCVYKWMLAEHEAYPSKVDFFKIEYLTASSTSLFLSILAGGIKSLVY